MDKPRAGHRARPPPESPTQSAPPGTHTSRLLGHPCQAASPRLKRGSRCLTPMRGFGHADRARSRDRRSWQPGNAGQRRTAGPGGPSPAQVASSGVQHKAGWTPPRKGGCSGGPPPPGAHPPREVTSTRGIFCSRPWGPGLRALSEAGSSSPRPPHTPRLPRPAQRRQRLPPPAPTRGDPAGHKGPRRPGAHLKRGESLMHSSNSTVMAAAARGAH